jgi:ribonuclease P protein component
MLPRTLRLKRPQDFQTVRQRGRRWRGPLFTMYSLPNGLTHNRFGIVVSKKVGNAVIRNLVKRRVRAAVSHWLPRLSGGKDCVISMNPPAADTAYQLLEAALENAFRDLRLFTAHDEEVVV